MPELVIPGPVIPGPVIGDIWAEMVEGHDRFAADFCDGTVPAHRPRAAVLACSDARVPPTVLFGQPPGSLFVVRLAGNIASAGAIASLTFATEHLGTRQVVVLGHSGCGAVAAAFAGVQDPELAPILSPLRELIDGCDHCGDAEAVVRANVARSMQLLTAHTGSLGQGIRSGRITLHGAVHDLSSGGLDEIEISPPAELTSTPDHLNP
jgi:carbonic anhydrase